MKQDNYAEAVKAGKIRVIGEEVDRVYLENVLAQRVNPDAVKQVADDLTVVYTPLHGAGYKLVPEALRASGLKKLYTVPEQMILDGNFPTVVKPNPELPEAFTLGIKLADEVGSDLIIATDPDSEGETTALYLADLLRGLVGQVTRIGYGVPLGGDIDYIDEMTLGYSLKGRTKL